MNDLVKRLQDLKNKVLAAFEKLDIESLKRQVDEIQKQSAAPGFWNDNLAAQEQMKKQAKLAAIVEPWLRIKQDIGDMIEIVQSEDDAQIANDDIFKEEIESQVVNLEKAYEDQKKSLLFTGKYDNYDAILRLSAGAGGTDAQDWAEMLERMYLRWAEKNDIKSEVIEESKGEEAGIKSATISLIGPYAYGRLKSENGVHRLVRLSPFNADNLRQTSFALVEILPQIDEPDEVIIDDKDLRVDVYRAGGHGGQSVNTTDSAVRITHLPTGISVAIQNERSQLQNKETAMKLLRSKLAQMQLDQHKDKLEEIKGSTKSAEWGSQIRNYVLHPYTLVKDVRTKYEEHDAQNVLDGNIDGFVDAYLSNNLDN